MSYYEKYLKYKNKYQEIKKQFGGKIEWKYTHKQEPRLDQDLVEKEYQTWISLGKPNNYSSNEVRFPLYTYIGKTIMRISDEASDVPVDEDCDSCKLRLPSYRENWKKSGGYVPPGQIYSIYFADDFQIIESDFLDDVKFGGVCIKCKARANELIDKKTSEEAARIAFEKSYRERSIGRSDSTNDLRRLGPAPTLADLDRRLGPAPTLADLDRRLGPAPTLADLYRRLGPAPTLADLYRRLGPAPNPVAHQIRLNPAPTHTAHQMRLNPAPTRAAHQMRLNPAPRRFYP
jgi:hypothetical protein